MTTVSGLVAQWREEAELCRANAERLTSALGIPFFGGPDRSDAAMLTAHADELEAALAADAEGRAEDNDPELDEALAAMEEDETDGK